MLAQIIHLRTLLRASVSSLQSITGLTRVVARALPPRQVGQWLHGKGTAMATAAAPTQTPCGGVSSVAIERLIDLIIQLQHLGVTIALPLAGLAYLVAGLAWMRGTIEAQEIAKRILRNTTIGLAIVLVSGGLVEVITAPLCGGGA